MLRVLSWSRGTLAARPVFGCGKPSHLPSAEPLLEALAFATAFTRRRHRSAAGIAGHLRGVGPGGGIVANAAAHELGHLLETLLHCPPLSFEGCAWESRGRINIISKH